MALPEQFCDLWQQHQRMSNGDIDIQSAILVAHTHLELIGRQRPPDQIDDPGERFLAEQIRH